MASVYLRHGSPVMVDYTPSSAVTAGDVVLIGNIPHICHTDIAANEKGAMAIHGGVYKCTATAAITYGAQCFWDATNEQVTPSIGAANKLLGTCVLAAAAADAEVWFYHHPMMQQILDT